MSDFMEYKNDIVFHPGHYLREVMEEENLTQEDFAACLDTTPKNLSLLLRGQQKLSPEMARKIAVLTNTSLTLWLNLQTAFDAVEQEKIQDEELAMEEEVLKQINYNYFVDNFGLERHPRDLAMQVKEVRGFLHVSSLIVLKKQDLFTSYRCQDSILSEKSIIAGNMMVQIAINRAKNKQAPKYDKLKFKEAYTHALSLTKEPNAFVEILSKEFYDAGVILVLLPAIPGSKINGACKKLKDNILLLVNDRNCYADSFWFTLFHEIGHIVHGDFGISTDLEKGDKEEKADEFAQKALIDEEEYRHFVLRKNFNPLSVQAFADHLSRDAGIIVGRLQKDGYVRYDDQSLNSLKRKYHVSFKSRQ